jgi:hypothetical protein
VDADTLAVVYRYFSLLVGLLVLTSVICFIDAALVPKGFVLVKTLRFLQGVVCGFIGLSLYQTMTGNSPTTGGAGMLVSVMAICLITIAGVVSRWNLCKFLPHKRNDKN